MAWAEVWRVQVWELSKWHADSEAAMELERASFQDCQEQMQGEMQELEGEVERLHEEVGRLEAELADAVSQKEVMWGK